MKHFLICCVLIAGFAVQAQDYPEQVTHFPGDLSNDSIVGTNDLMLLLSLWGIDYAELIPESACSGAIAIDYSGYEYELVPIGDQCWFAENLRAENYANGDVIAGNLSSTDWANTTSGAQAVYGEGNSNCNGNCDEVENLTTYGRLYNWYAVNDSCGLCPSGWHVPSDQEWMTLEMELGMSFSQAILLMWRGTDEGAQMKSSSSDTPNWDGTNISGFSALPGGRRGSSFNGEDHDGYWWSASPIGISQAYYRHLISGDEYVSRFEDFKRIGHSVRCVRD